MDKIELQINELYEKVLWFSSEKKLKNTVAVLPFVKELLLEEYKDLPMVREYFIHGLSMAWMLITLRVPVEEEERDLMLASAVLHVLPEALEDYEIQVVASRIEVDPKVINFVQNITRADELTKKDMAEYYELIEEDRLLLLVKMVERSNVVEHLCDMTTEESKQFIFETKRYLFPLCLSARERYPEFGDVLRGVLEKMRGLIQVMDILYRKYDAEEDALYDEILNLKEENARIRVAIRERYQQ